MVPSKPPTIASRGAQGRGATASASAAVHFSASKTSRKDHRPPQIRVAGGFDAACAGQTEWLGRFKDG